MTAPAGIAPADVTTTPTTAPAIEPAPAPAPADVARPTKAAVKRGRVVTFTFRDAITGQQLDGHGVAIDVPTDGSAIAVLPLATAYLFIPAGDVQVVELDG